MKRSMLVAPALLLGLAALLLSDSGSPRPPARAEGTRLRPDPLEEQKSRARQALAPREEVAPERREGAPALRAALPGALRLNESIGLLIRVEIDGIAPSAGVIAVEGLESFVEVTEFRGGADGIVRKVPGVVRASDIKLLVSPGTLADALWQWFTQVQKAEQNTRKNASIIFTDHRGRPVARYNVAGLWPHHWTGFRSLGPGSVLPAEEITFACDSIVRGEVQFPGP